MKKSEARQIIADWMSGERHGTGITTKYTLESAQELLDILVNEIGMLPPRTAYQYPLPMEMRDGSKRLYYPETKWEPENET